MTQAPEDKVLEALSRAAHDQNDGHGWKDGDVDRLQGHLAAAIPLAEATAQVVKAARACDEAYFAVPYDDQAHWLAASELRSALSLLDQEPSESG